MVNQNHKKSVLVPIILFSWFKFPLTLEELKRYAWQQNLTDEEVVAAVSSLPKVKQAQGLVWLGNWAPQRDLREQLAQKIWGKVARWRWLFSYIPFVQQVYVTNTTAYNNTSESSDIDLLIIGQAKRLWVMRACLLVVFNIFNLRVRSIDRFAKFSPEFYLSDKVLDVQSLAVERDYYLSYWLADMVPIWPDGEHRQFRQANQWFKHDLPMAWHKPKLKKYRYLSVSWLRRLVEKILSGKWGNKIEDWVYAKQRRMIELNLRRLGVNPEVVANRDIIKLHFNDRRAQVRDAIEQAIDDLARKTT
ncbi:hypothetical protein KJ836_01275 [Patescibacteria group bacterium]|nr:hypothetical protein [Patescibacteria group bacterium]